MKKWTLTLCAGIVLLVLAAILAYPKLMDNQKEISTEFVSMTAETPNRKRVQEEKKDDEGPVMINISGLKAQLEARQDSVKEATDSLSK